MSRGTTVRLAIVLAYLLLASTMGLGCQPYPPPTRPATQTPVRVMLPSPTPAARIVVTLTERADECASYHVTVPSARVRGCPGFNCTVVAGFVEGQRICVLGALSSLPDWYVVPLPDRSEGYIHESVVAPIDGNEPVPRIPYTLPTDVPRGSTPLATSIPPSVTAQAPPTQPLPTPPPPTQAPAPPPRQPQPVCECGGNYYNCEHFATQRQAQACYVYCLGVVRYDVHWLDGDNDGVACESLP